MVTHEVAVGDDIGRRALQDPGDALERFLLAAAGRWSDATPGPRVWADTVTRGWDDGGSSTDSGWSVAVGPLVVSVTTHESHAEEMVGPVSHDVLWQGSIEGLPIGVAVRVRLRRTTYGGQPSWGSGEAVITAEATLAAELGQLFQRAFRE